MFAFHFAGMQETPGVNKYKLILREQVLQLPQITGKLIFLFPALAWSNSPLCKLDACTMSVT